MKPDVTPPIATPAETQWVEAELVRSLMRIAGNTQAVGILLIPVFIGVLYDDHQAVALVTWVICACAVAATRFSIIRKYVGEVGAAGSLAQLEFFRRYSALWPLSALVWGMSTLLF